jgi:hypothetical protein
VEKRTDERQFGRTDKDQNCTDTRQLARTDDALY